MARVQDIFGPGSNSQGRIISDYNRLAEIVRSVKMLGLRVGLTSGSFDILHVGHARYLEHLKKNNLCDFLIVGIETDAKIQARKGPKRPVVPFEERAEMLTHLRHLDLVVPKDVNHPQWHLIKTVNPDVLLETKETYDEEELAQLKELCSNIVILEPQATTSTTAKIRRLFIGWSQEVKDKMVQAIEEVLRTGGM